jgi:putative transposase
MGVGGGESLVVGMMTPVGSAPLPRCPCKRGRLNVNEARRLKELERENRELKQMLADSLLKNRVLEAVCEKKL